MIFQNDLQFYTNLAGGQPDRVSLGHCSCQTCWRPGSRQTRLPKGSPLLYISAHCPGHGLCLGSLSLFRRSSPLLATLFGEQCVTKQQNKREQKRTENKATGIENRMQRQRGDNDFSVDCAPTQNASFLLPRFLLSLLLWPVCWLFINVEMPLQIGVSFGREYQSELCQGASLMKVIKMCEGNAFQKQNATVENAFVSN